MAFLDSEQTNNPPKRKKGLPFKRTAVRPPSASAPAISDQKPEENDIDFFRRSNDVFSLAADEEEEKDTKVQLKSPENHNRKRRKFSSDSEDGVSWKKTSFGSDDDFPKKEKGKGKAKSFSLDESDDDFLAKGKGKGRAKCSLDESDDDLIMDVKGKGKEIYSPAKTITPKKATSRTAKGKTDDENDDFYSPPGRRAAASPIRTRSSRLGAKPSTDSDNDEPGLRKVKSRFDDSDEDKSWSFDTKKPISLLDSDDDDLEITKTKPEPEDDSDVELQEIAASDRYNEWVRKAEQLESQNQDVIITFLVASPLENAKPIRVKRKMGQELGLILETWISMQMHKFNLNIDRDVIPSLFLTWKGKKVYKYTTPVSLGVQVDADGKLISTDNEGYQQNALYLEVWSEERYEEHLKQKEQERNLRLGLVGASQDVSGDEGAPLTPEPVKRKEIKVILKAKEFEPVKLTIYDDTTVDQLVTAFRKKRNIAPSHSILIYFDGEHLDDGSLVVDADIDADDTNQFEVHVR
ncbi:ubiquitin-2 like Rad60 SUMO-like-domain-containing protein [Podospora aff. communis PSN243]|uniref:Ubiquitin-2 like Rad60 SUMO-like-domain-containing protein n=1 Tax=Podospora aff. communis PSN243 TaxID=3040156 RepID=A0AAV9GDA4_9PEZI|nr:ubiquitin-2 like Rad60 SUMO-like-domain-containing protein [Podospora aff. communis PSN243]